MKIEDSNLETIQDIQKITALVRGHQAQPAGHKFDWRFLKFPRMNKWVSVGAAAAVHCRIAAML